MYLRFLVLYISAISWLFGQQDSVKYVFDNDSITKSSYELEEVIILEKGVDFRKEERKKYLLLQRRVLKVYPYAKLTADNLTTLTNNLAKLKTEKEKKKYLKIVEAYLEKQFEPQLKKLSRKEGQILVKLIHRQTGTSTFDLIKDFKSGWKAFWSNNTAKLFDINLKTTYDPYQVTEDFLIEGILLKAFKNNQLLPQPANPEIDYKRLQSVWVERLKQAKEKTSEEN
ncbi:MAG: DUF4294 domain-containing protein [Flavobacteriales bacterium]|nr:DUF4294 domain-containing protein [Flavobacteriales bacterium]